MIRFGFPVDVRRPVEEVFAYVVDPANLPEWQRSDGVEQLTAGDVMTGTRFREVRTLLGRRMETLSEVSVFEPRERFAVDVDSAPARVTDHWRFEPIPEGTRVHFSTEGHARTPLRPLERVLARVLERRRREHHGRLKQALEARGATQPG